MQSLVKQKLFLARLPEVVGRGIPDEGERIKVSPSAPAMKSAEESLVRMKLSQQAKFSAESFMIL